MIFSGISYKARRRWKNFFIAATAVAALLVVIWLLRVGVDIRFGEALQVDAKIGPVKLVLLPKPEKPNVKNFSQ